jgi:hypothetical protein
VRKAHYREGRSPEIGRAKTVIIHSETAREPVGIVSEIVSRVSPEDDGERLVVLGPVYFRDKSWQHIKSIVLPVIDRITEGLNISKRHYEVSVVNAGATGASGTGIEIGGFSADLPLALAILSSSLQLAIRQDVVSTGHIASLAGDVAPVRGLPAKLKAAIQAPGVSAFIVPDLDKDSSLKSLTPIEYQAAKESLLARKGEIRIYSIRTIFDAIKILMEDESIVLGSLKSGFFNMSATAGDTEGVLSRAIAHLAEGNEKRFWDALEHLILDHHTENAHSLLRSYADFHIRNHRYPEKLGEKLFRLVISLPPATRKLDYLFPLLPMASCIELSQHAKGNDHDDVRQLHKAAFGEGLDGLSHQVKETGAIQLSGDSGEKGLVEKIMAELSEDNLAEKVGQRYDEARGRFVMSSVTVKDGFEFNETITAFYAHMFRHTSSSAGSLERSALSSDALDLLEEAFGHKGGYRAALSEGKHGTNGGMRVVLDTITEHFKQKEKGKYINRVFKESIDPSDWDAKVRLTAALQERIEPYLPADLKGLPARKLARHWEEIIRCYVESMDKVSDLFKSL